MASSPHQLRKCRLVTHAATGTSYPKCHAPAPALCSPSQPPQRSSSLSLRLVPSDHLPNDRSLFLSLSGSFSDPPRAAASSMSIRRFASNRPTLQRKVHMPPAPTFASPSPTQLSFASPLPLSLFQFPYSKTRSSDASPVTPIAQIMPTTPLFPPPMVTTLASLSKYMPRDSPPVGLCPANHTPDYLSHSPVLGLYGARCTSPIFPLGMPSAVLLGMPSPLCLDDPLSPQLPSPPEAIPDACTTPATLPSSITSCPQPQEAILRARPRPPLRLSLPRRLSYNRTGSTSPPSATTPRRASHELASPAVIGSHSSPAPLHKGLRRVQNLGTPNTSLAHAHQPRMAELGSYF